MAEINYLWIGLVMGLFLIAVATVLGPLRARTSNRYRSTRGRLGGEHDREESAAYIPGITKAATVIEDLRAIARRPITWMVTFVVFAVALTVVGIFFVGGLGAPEEIAPAAGPIIVGLLLVLVAGYVLLGTYVSARRRGHPNAHALAESMGVLSLLIVVAVSGRLLFL